jgi:hypothetical protein
MSDQSVAPAAPNPAQVQSNPTPQTEVQINQNPVNSPNPVGSQAPEKPQDAAAERRASIQRAFDRASNPPQKGVQTPPKSAPAAEAKAGHNKPPEETKPERIDLRKRPSPDSAVPSAAQPRDRGRFAPRPQDGQTGQVGRAQDAQNAQPGQPVRKLPANAPYAQPPSRMSERAKAEWHAAPESVRGEVDRMQSDFVKAYRVYKTDFEEMSKIRHFHKMAADQGTTLQTALTNYVGMEQKLRADPVAGLDVIVNNLNLRTPDGEKIGLRDIAYHVLSQSPDQLRQLQMGNQQQAASQQIGALHQEIAGLRQTVQQMHTNQQFVQTRSAIDVFADTHPRFDELGTVIERELKLGFDLETAYRRAELLHPTTRAPQTRTPSAQTREPDRSIHGTHEIGPNGTSRRPQKASPTPRAAVANAIARLNGGQY